LTYRWLEQQDQRDIILKTWRQISLGRVSGMSPNTIESDYQIYEASQIIVVLCKNHVALGEITDAVIDYLYDLTNSQLVILAYS
jgi:hypothetical protein